MFFSSAKKKLARDTAAGLIGGQATLLALWTLLHAGVIAAMRRSDDGIEPNAYAATTNMEAAVLLPLLDYLVDKGLMAESKGRYALSATGEALIECESGVLQFLYAYQPVVQMMEHLLARLKVYGSGVYRKSDALTASNALRHGPEVYPAFAEALKKCKATHLLDLHGGTGDLIAHVGAKMPTLVGVGLSAEGPMARAANDLFAAEKMDKRFLAVTASGVDALIETRRTFERTGISQQLWHTLDAVVACDLLGGHLSQGREHIVAMLAAGGRAFPKATFVFAEPCADVKGEPTYYAPEMRLLLRLGRSEPLASEAWEQIFKDAGLHRTARHRLATDGLCVWTCVPAGRGG